MKRKILVVALMLGGAGYASAQSGFSPSSDVLGAHLNYGRGCSACHAPHSGAHGNGNGKITDPSGGNAMLWGEDATSLYGKTITTGGGKFSEVLPTSLSATTPDVAGMLTCLTCHDGNYAQNTMMKNRVYEALPSTYGNSNATPTLLGSSGASAGNYLNDHPMGLTAKVNCGGASDWDCTVSSNGVVQMTGARSKLFVRNYGFFVQLGSYNNTAVVVCTTCHNPHVMNVVTVTSATSGLPAGTYPTMFFLRAPYNPNDSNPTSNQTSQFCRQCHADKSNEMNGSSVGTVF